MIEAPQLSASEAAFVRAWAEGLDLDAAWALYRGRAADDGGASARRELRRLRDRLHAMAVRQGRPDLAALWRRDPDGPGLGTTWGGASAEAGAGARTGAEAGTARGGGPARPGGATGLPDLASFAARWPADFHSEAELLALYREAYGAAPTTAATQTRDNRLDAEARQRRRQQRRDRLRQRLLAALATLTGQAVQAPQPQDRLAQWLDPRLVARLEQAGLQRLEDLQRHVQVHGAGWHRPVRRVGPVAAQRLALWWHTHQGSLGPWPAGLVDDAAARTGAAGTTAAAGTAGTAAMGLDRPTPRLAPLERFRPPAALRGAPAGRPIAGPVAGQAAGQVSGRFAGPAGARVQAPAATVGAPATWSDTEAVQAWLATHAARPHTARAHRREAERLWLWAVWVRGRTLAQLGADDARLYRAFLARPPAIWCAPRNTPRHHPDWRPLEGPLSERSIRAAESLLRAMARWLCQHGYLASNPWAPPGRDGADADAHTGAGAGAGASKAAATGSRPPDVARPAPVHRPAARALRPAEIRHLNRWLDLQTTDRASQRLRAVLGLALDTGMRPAELVAARLDWLRFAGVAASAADGLADRPTKGLAGRLDIGLDIGLGGGLRDGGADAQADGARSAGAPSADARLAPAAAGAAAGSGHSTSSAGSAGSAPSVGPAGPGGSATLTRSAAAAGSSVARSAPLAVTLAAALDPNSSSAAVPSARAPANPHMPGHGSTGSPVWAVHIPAATGAGRRAALSSRTVQALQQHLADRGVGWPSEPATAGAGVARDPSEALAARSVALLGPIRGPIRGPMRGPIQGPIQARFGRQIQKPLRAEARGHAATAAEPEAESEVPSVAAAGLSAGWLYDLLTDAFRRCADWLQAQDPAAATRLRQASTHWLRHSHALLQQARGLRGRALAEQLGHRSAGSASRYRGTAG